MDVGTIIDLVNFCVTAVKTIIKYQAINRVFTEKLERLGTYALRFQSLSLVINRLKNTYKLHPRLEQDTNSSIFQARNALMTAKINLSDWQRRLKNGGHKDPQGFRDGIKQIFHKADWLVRGESETDSILTNLRQHNNHLHKGIQLCALYTPEADDSDLLVVNFVERALNRQNNRAGINQLQIGKVEVDSAYGVDITRVHDQTPAYNGCILETRSMSTSIAASDTRRIARLLGERPKGPGLRHPFIALPVCRGLSHTQLILEPPIKSTEPYQSLRSLLAGSGSKPTHSLNSRLELSVHLARAILILHSLELVHKNIRPETILVTRATTANQDSPIRLGHPCLIGFGTTRSTDVKTQLSPEFYGISQDTVDVDKTLHGLIYKHPKHWVRKRTEAYQMRDDIYSLGVCLLEIALWKSLFNWMSGLGAFINDTNTLRLCRPADFPADRTRQKWKKENQQLLVGLAKKAIPATMGETYRDVVVACLMCWEKTRLRQPLTEDILKDRHAQEMTKEADQSISFFKEVISKLESIRL